MRTLWCCSTLFLVVLLAPAAAGAYSDETDRRILEAALAAHPRDPDLLHKGAEEAQDPALKIALEAEAYRLATEADPKHVDLPRSTILAGSLLHRLIDAGLLDRALAFYRDMPAPVRACLDAPSKPCWPQAGDAALEAAGTWGLDYRWDLAAAALLANDRAMASRLMQIAEKNPISDVVSRDESFQKATDLLRYALAARTPQGTDPFGALTAPLEADRHRWTPALYLLHARLAEGAGYPAIAAYSLGMAAKSVADRFLYRPELGVPARVQPAETALAAERAAWPRISRRNPRPPPRRRAPGGVLTPARTSSPGCSMRRLRPIRPATRMATD
jgi:hypothetical protein